MPDTTPHTPEFTRLLKAFEITTGYDQIWLDLGDVRYFIYPDLAIKLADALRRHSAQLMIGE